MKASNSNILSTSLFALVVLLCSCTKESVEPVTQTSNTTSSERKLVKVEKPFSNSNSNEFGSETPGSQNIQPVNTDVTPYTDNLSGITPKTSGGQSIENGIKASPIGLSETKSTDVTPYPNTSIKGKKPITSGGNGEDFIQKKNIVSDVNINSNQTNVSPYNSNKFKKRLIPSEL